MINDRRVCAISTSESSGSGLLITDRLVLTADHLLIGDGIQARFPEGGFECEVRWRSAELDVAVLRITDETWMSPDLPELRWGRLVTGSAGVPAEAAAGAGLFVEGLLVALVVEDPPEAGSRRLGAVSVEALTAEPGFAELVQPPALEPAELAGLQARPAPARNEPMDLLRAEAEVVPFHGRDDVLARLRDWLDGPDAASVRVLIGPGGQGKTRVAQQFAHAAQNTGRLVLQVRADAPAALFDRLSEVRDPLLLVVDEAEKQGDRLVRLAAMLPDRVRLLLVARSGGAWLRELAVRSEPFAALLPSTGTGDDLAGAIEELGPLQGDPRIVFRAALKAFAERLGVTVPSIRTPRLTDECYRNVLAVHLEAMARLLNAGGDAGRDAASVVLADQVERWVQQGRVKYGLGGLPVPVLRHAIVVATLCTVRRRPGESLVDLLAQVPSLADQPPGIRVVVAEWLTDVFGEPGWLCAPMRPEVLHEHLVGAELAAHPGVLDGVAAELTERQAGEMLTVLARAGAPVSVGRRRDYAVVVAVAAVIDSLIRRFPGRMARAAWSAAAVVDGAAAGPLHAGLESVGPGAGAFRPVVEGWGARPGRRAWLAGWVSRVWGRHPGAVRAVGTGVAVVALASPLLLLVPQSEAGQQLEPPVAGGVVAAAEPGIGEPVTVPSPSRSSAPAASPSPSRSSVPAASKPVRSMRTPSAVVPAATARSVSPGRLSSVPPASPAASAASPADRRPPASDVAVMKAPPGRMARFLIEVDGSKLTASTVTIPGQESDAGVGAVQRFRLAAGRYQLGDAWFTVTAAGKVVVDPGATYLKVRDGRRLEVIGLEVTIDPARLDLASGFGVEGVATGLSGGAAHTLRVLPGRYRVTVGDRRTDASFTVTPGGVIDYDKGISYLSGRGKHRLELIGVRVTVDARELEVPTFGVQGVTAGPRPTAEPQSFRVLPGSYRLSDGRDFTVTRTGMIDYRAEHRAHLGGAGTSTLTVRTSAPPRD